MKNEDGTQATIEQETAPMLLEKNWKREEKRKTKEGLTEKAFDCRPYDSQIRAYVLTMEKKL